MSTYNYRTDQELPAYSIAWSDGNQAIIDFSTGWTATVKIAFVNDPNTVVLSKTTDITLDSVSPNYVIDFTIADMTTIEAAAGTIPTSGVECIVYAYCKRDADSRDRLFRPGREPRFTLYSAPA